MGMGNGKKGMGDGEWERGKSNIIYLRLTNVQNSDFFSPLPTPYCPMK
jgi:hypothetical protein